MRSEWRRGAILTNNARTGVKTKRNMRHLQCLYYSKVGITCTCITILYLALANEPHLFKFDNGRFCKVDNLLGYGVSAV